MTDETKPILVLTEQSRKEIFEKNIESAVERSAANHGVKTLPDYSLKKEIVKKIFDQCIAYAKARAPELASKIDVARIAGKIKNYFRELPSYDPALHLPEYIDQLADAEENSVGNSVETPAKPLMNYSVRDIIGKDIERTCEAVGKIRNAEEDGTISKEQADAQIHEYFHGQRNNET
jgi:hypothetical protein